MNDITKQLEDAKAAIKDGYKIRLWLNIAITVDTVEDMLKQIANVSQKTEGYEILYGGFDQVYSPD